MKFFRALAAASLSALFVVAGNAHAATYTVQPGDYLWKIATEHGISVQQLMSMNGLTSYTIYPGQVLQVPGGSRTHVVQSGETMWIISQKYGIPLNKLINANPQIANPNNIWPGLSVNIPVKPAKFLNGQFPLKRGTYEPYTNNYGASRSWSPEGETVRSHDGIDILAAKWTPIYSVADGQVINYGWNEYGGWRLTVQVDNATAFYYAHLAGYASGITKGSQIKKGQLIGYVGNTGYGPQGTEGKFEPHLHFGIYNIGSSPWTTVNPYDYLRWWELG